MNCTSQKTSKRLKNDGKLFILSQSLPVYVKDLHFIRLDGKDNRESRASDDGNGVPERIGMVETNWNESDKFSDASAE